MSKSKTVKIFASIVAFTGCLCILYFNSGDLSVSSNDVPLRSEAERSYVLEGHSNCRELGGLPMNGGYIKNGIIFRTGRLCEATPNDVELFKSWGWNTIIDLRTQREIDREGLDRLPTSQENGSGGRFKNLFLPMFWEGDNDNDYINYILNNDKSISKFFELLANPESYPLNFHCSCGKDRTGIMTALTLELVGTPRNLIYVDFLYSLHNNEEVFKENLDRVFEYIDNHGGIKNFLQQRGVPLKTLEAIPPLLLDDSSKK